MYQKLIGTPEFVSLLAPEHEGIIPLSFAAARQVASLHLSSSDACAALYDAQGNRLATSPGFAHFFGLDPAHVDRHRIGRPPRDGWLSERGRFAQTTALTCRPMRSVEIGAGFRVESFYASVQDADLPDQFVLQTSRRVIRCVTEGPTVVSGDLTYALHGTWGAIDPLSRRQVEVLRLVTKGYGNDRIGHAIGRTKRAVEWHIRGLFAKLKVTDRVHLHIVGMRAGLDDIPDDVWAQILVHRFGTANASA